MTKNAKKILSIINASGEHLTAEQIFLQLKEASEPIVLATVYNNLNTLYEIGMIRRISVEGCPDRYDKTERHDHLVCRKCGALSDVTLENLTDRIEQQLGMEIDFYDLKIHYLCPECREAVTGIKNRVDNSGENVV